MTPSFAAFLLCLAPLAAATLDAREPAAEPFAPLQEQRYRPGAEASEFARQIAWTLSRGDGSLVLAAIDYAAILDEVTAGFDVKSDFLVRMIQSLREEHQFAQHILDDRNPEERYQCVGLDYEGDRLWATFRHRSSRGLEYHRYWLVPVDERVFRIRDIELLAAGESWSDRVRRLFLEQWTDRSRSRLEQLDAIDLLFVEHARDLRRLEEALDLADGRKALEVLEVLPPDLRASRPVVAMALEAARTMDEAPFADVHAAARAAFPHDEGIDLFAWRHAEEVGAWRQLIELHGRLASSHRLLADGYRDAICALAHLQLGDHKSAAILAERAVSREPEHEPAWNVLLDVALARMDFPRVREVLRTLEFRFGRDHDLLGDPRFTSYRASDEFASSDR